MHRHLYTYIYCATSTLKENFGYISDSGFEIVHMSQTKNGCWYIVYDMNPRGD